MPKFNGVSEVKDNDTYEQLVKQGSFTGSDGVVYTYDQTGRLYVTDDHVEEELRGYITDLQNKVGSLESGSSDISENKLDKNLGAENSGKLLNIDSSGNITTLDNGIAGQVLTSNGESQSPIWSNLDLPEQNVISLIGTEDDPIILLNDIEDGKSYLIGGYFKRYPNSTAIYHFPTVSEAGSIARCTGVGTDVQGRKIIEIYGWSIVSANHATKEVPARNANYIERIYLNPNGTSGISANSYVGLKQINYKDIVDYIWAPTSGGKAGQILKSNGNNAPTWIDLPNSGIEILTGTAESPINFATDMEVNHLYSCSGVFFNTVASSAQSSISGKTVNFQDQGRSFLFYKRNNTSVVCLASSHNTGNQTTSVIIFSAMYGITEITFDSTTGELTNIRSGMGFGRVNGIEGNGNAQALGIYAPIESGTSGQLLQSNGEGVAPTWVTANYASSADLETKLDVNQGTENINKLLNVGSDGNISFIDNNYITSSVNNLDNYYLKTETYTREEVNNQINTIRTGLFKPVDVLPDVGEEGYIYLVSNSNSQGDISTQAEVDNTRDEYIWIADSNKYEYIGSTSIDLTNYYTKEETDNKFVSKQLNNIEFYYDNETGQEESTFIMAKTGSIAIGASDGVSDAQPPYSYAFFRKDGEMAFINIQTTGAANQIYLNADGINIDVTDGVSSQIALSIEADGIYDRISSSKLKLITETEYTNLLDRIAALEANSITTEDVLTINQGNSQQ